ncbi:MAG: membrane protein insertion efficiency factor YidD [Phycisphaerales bacterium]|nr:membrane protein insertion efficiency factor YidD [Phycisphaerales bacterium]
MYQKTLGHLIGGSCRFNPSCSNYALESLREHGAWHGSRLIIRRISRCHPWGGKGDDPVPPRT